MKELSIEQKAKRYDVAIKKAESLYKAAEPMSGCNVIIETFFPELKESEDEKIRKDLIGTVHLAYDCGCSLNKEQHDKYIAWLEKQGEHANFLNKIQIGDKVTRNKDGVLVNLSQLNRVAKKDEKQGEQKSAKNIIELWKGMRLEVYQQASGNRHEPNYSDDTTKMFSLNDIDEIIEKMSEQKPTDKVEPKFKVGDTITDPTDSTFTFHINAIKDGKYMESDKDWVLIKEADSDYILVEQTPVWSEEDKYNLSDIEAMIHTMKGGGLNADRLINWLKSLRPQNRWKPSEYHLKSLQAAIDIIGEQTLTGTDLKELSEQLKKLKS